MKKACLTLLTVLASIYLLAQDAQEKTTQVDVTKTTTSSNWYASPLVWIIGAAVFILLLVALTSGSRNRSDRVVIKKTVRDTDV